MAVRDLELAVPGTYQSGKPVIQIDFVLPTFQVITSKQRPRKFSLRGRDGKEYTYCLKGQEIPIPFLPQLITQKDTRTCDKTSE